MDQRLALLKQELKDIKASTEVLHVHLGETIRSAGKMLDIIASLSNPKQWFERPAVDEMVEMLRTKIAELRPTFPNDEGPLAAGMFHNLDFLRRGEPRYSGSYLEAVDLFDALVKIARSVVDDGLHGPELYKRIEDALQSWCPVYDRKSWKLCGLEKTEGGWVRDADAASRVDWKHQMVATDDRRMSSDLLMVLARADVSAVKTFHRFAYAVTVRADTVLMRKSAKENNSPTGSGIWRRNDVVVQVKVRRGV